MSSCARYGRGGHGLLAFAAGISTVILAACTDRGTPRDPSVSGDTPPRGLSVFADAPPRGLSVSPDDLPPELSASVDTLPSGAVPVLNPAAAPRDDGRNWIIRERTRIGRAGGEGPDVFGRVSGLAIGSDGVVHVFDGFARELRSFHVDGRLSAVRGRRGGGPNEFEAVVALSLAPDGSLWLVDAGNGRYARLQADGTFLTVRRPITTYNLPWLGGWDAHGSFYDQAAVVSETRSMPVLVRMSAPGTPTDTVRLPAIPLRQPGLGSMSFPLPFAPSQLWAFDPSGRIWSALSTSYELTAIAMTGDTVAIVRRNHERRPLRLVQRDSVRQYVRNLSARFGVQVSADMIPDVAPLIRWISVDDRGFVWVCATGLDPCTTVDVFDPRGVYVDSVTLPVPAIGQTVVRGNVIAYPAHGEYETPLIIIGDVAGRDRTMTPREVPGGW